VSTDPKHGRHIPQGRDVAALLRGYFARIGNQVAADLTQGRNSDLMRWVKPLVQDLRPLMLRYYAGGAHMTWQRLVRLLERRRRSKSYGGLQTKIALPQRIPMLMTAFDVLLTEVQHAIDHMVYEFVRETLATASNEAVLAYEALREEQRQGIEAGESLKKITARVMGVFTEPMRAFRIAATETSRVMHAGQLDAARQSKVVSGVKWLASSDACEKCLKIDGNVVKIGEPFAVNEKAPAPYRLTLAPPLHPLCQCALQEELL